MRYTTPEWLLENLEKRLRLALGQSPVPENEEYVPKLDPVGGVTVEFPFSSAA